MTYPSFSNHKAVTEPLSLPLKFLGLDTRCKSGNTETPHLSILYSTGCRRWKTGGGNSEGRSIHGKEPRAPGN